MGVGLGGGRGMGCCRDDEGEGGVRGVGWIHDGGRVHVYMKL